MAFRLQGGGEGLGNLRWSESLAQYELVPCGGGPAARGHAAPRLLRRVAGPRNHRREHPLPERDQRTRRRGSLMTLSIR